jgi:hypothetical protein
MGAAALPTQPLRDPDARTRLYAAATRATPALLARDRKLAVEAPFDVFLPDGGIPRGTTVALDGPAGAGATSIACALVAAATAAGEWAAIVDTDQTFGARAALDAGVALERCAVVRPVSPDRWTTVVAALLDGVALVVATPPPALKHGDARRLVARARERAAVLVAFGAWPVEASLRLHARGGEWHGLGPGSGLLVARDLDIDVEAKGMRRNIARAG